MNGYRIWNITINLLQNIYYGILLSHKKERNNTTCMDLDIITLSKSDKERQIPHDITYTK